MSYPTPPSTLICLLALGSAHSTHSLSHSPLDRPVLSQAPDTCPRHPLTSSLPCWPGRTPIARLVPSHPFFGYRLSCRLSRNGQGGRIAGHIEREIREQGSLNFGTHWCFRCDGILTQPPATQSRVTRPSFSSLPILPRFCFYIIVPPLFCSPLRLLSFLVNLFLLSSIFLSPALFVYPTPLSIAVRLPRRTICDQLFTYEQRPSACLLLLS